MKSKIPKGKHCYGEKMYISRKVCPYYIGISKEYNMCLFKMKITKDLSFKYYNKICNTNLE